MLAQAAKGDDGAAWLLVPARVFQSPFFIRRFLPAWHVAIVVASRFQLNIYIIRISLGMDYRMNINNSTNKIVDYNVFFKITAPETQFS